MPYIREITHENIHQDGVFYVFLTVVAEDSRASERCQKELRQLAEGVFEKLRQDKNPYLPMGANIQTAMRGCESELTLGYVSGEAVQAVFEALLLKKGDYITADTRCVGHVAENLLQLARVKTGCH